MSIASYCSGSTPSCPGLFDTTSTACISEKREVFEVSKEYDFDKMIQLLPETKDKKTNGDHVTAVTMNMNNKYIHNTSTVNYRHNTLRTQLN